MANAQYDKFIELRKSGVDAKAARVQAYGEVAPVAPTPTDVNSDANRLARLQASGGSPTAIANLQPTVAPTTPTTPVTPAPMVQAPVDPTTGLSKPLEATPTPVTPVAPVAEVKAPEPIKQAKTEQTVDYNVSTGREQQIQDNISKITQASPNLLKDRNAYNQAFGYETADAGKKALLDSTFSGQVKPSQDDIFNSMRSGVSVGDPKSTEFRQAQARIATFKKFSTYDTASLATSLQSGDLLVGTKAYNDLVSDPAMSAKIQKAQAFNKGVVDLAKIGETQTANIMASNPTVANALADGNLSKEEYDQLTNNEEVSAQLQKVETNKTKYETIKAQYDAVEDDVNTEFDGKEVTDSFKAKVAADRRKGMYKDYQIASLEYQNALGTYTNLKDDATALLGQNMKLYETAQAEKAQIAGEERQMKNQLALSQAQFDQKIAQQAQSMGTPELAIPDVISQYAQLGVMATVSPQEHIARAKQFIAKGGTLGEYISQMQKDFQSKDAYKAKFAPKATENYELKEVGGKTYKFNQATGQYEVLSGGTITSTTPTGNIVPVTAGNKTVRLDQSGASGFESAINQLTQSGIPIVVGQGARDQTATIKEMADRYGIAFNASNPAETAQKLRTAGHQVADPGKSNHESGMAIDVYGSSKLDAVTPAQEKILNANGWYSANIPGDAGHFEYKGVGGTGIQGTQYTDSDIELLAELANMDASARNTALKAQGIPLKAVTDYMAKAKAGGIPPTESQKQAALGIMSNIQGIAELDWTDAVGKFDYSRGLGLQDAENARTLIDNLGNASALNNLGLLKGPMSDKDIAFLKSVSSKLDTVQSNSQFEKNIVEMYNIAARKAGLKEITKLSEIPSGRILPGQTTEPSQPSQPTPTNTGAGQVDSLGIR